MRHWWAAAIVCGLLLPGNGRLVAEGGETTITPPVSARAPDIQTLRIRVEWGDPVPRLWGGLLELSSGEFSAPVSLGVAADDAGTFGLKERTVWFQRRSGRVYDGLEVSLRADASAQLHVTLQSASDPEHSERLTIPLAELLNAPGGRSVLMKNRQGGRIMIRRAPGDTLPVKFSRPHLVFEAGEPFSFHVTFNGRTDRSSRKPARHQLEWTIHKARSTTRLGSGQIEIVPPQGTTEKPQTDVAIRWPTAEGAYDLDLTWRIEGERAASRRLQGVVVASADSRSVAEAASRPRTLSSNSLNPPQLPLPQFPLLPLDSPLLSASSPTVNLAQSLRLSSNFQPGQAEPKRLSKNHTPLQIVGGPAAAEHNPAKAFASPRDNGGSPTSGRDQSSATGGRDQSSVGDNINLGDKRVDSFHPGKAGTTRRIGPPSNPPILHAAAGLDESVATTGRRQIPSPLKWQAYRLKVERPGTLHRLVLTVTARPGQPLGFSILEPNSAGQLMPMGLDFAFVHPPGPRQSTPALKSPPLSQVTQTGAAIPGDPAEAPKGQTLPLESLESSRTHRRELLFWPRVGEPVLLAHNLGSKTSFELENVELFEVRQGHLTSPMPLGATTTSPVATGTTPGRNESNGTHTGRWIGPYLTRPVIARTFGGTETLDMGSGRSLDDWETFRLSGERMTQYLRQAEYNCLILTSFSQGSGLYPSEILTPSPLYDSGVYHSLASDPVRKDVLELLFRQFDRAGLALIPGLRFSTPLSRLEEWIAEGAEKSAGLEQVNRDGKTRRDLDSGRRGNAPWYNPLDPRVQSVVIEAVRELTTRYQAHNSFGGVALDLSNPGYLTLTNLDWGYDDVTVARFRKSTGISWSEPVGMARFPARAEALTVRFRREWIRWRCQEIAEFHKQIAKVVTDAHPSARVIFSMGNLIEGAQDDVPMADAIREEKKLSELLPEQGVNPAAYARVERTILLRPSVDSTFWSPALKSIYETINDSPDLARPFRSTSSGAVFLYPSHEFRLPAFADVSPWQPAFPLISAHLIPSPRESRRALARSLAVADSQAMFFSSGLIPTESDDSLRSLRRMYTALPAIPFEIVNGASNRQPLVVRMARDEKRAWLMLINDFGGRTQVRIQLRSTGEASPKPVLPKDSPLSITPGTGGECTLVGTLQPYEIQAWEINDRSARLDQIEVHPDAERLDRISSKIQELNDWLTEVQSGNRPLRIAIENSGFETRVATSPTPLETTVTGASATRQEGTSASDSIPGWTVDRRGSGFATIDSQSPRSGQGALKIVPRGGEIRIGTTVSIQRQRHLRILSRLRSDTPATTVTLTFEAKTEAGKPLTRSVQVQVDTQWQDYVFRIKDVPFDQISNGRFELKVTGHAQVWMDDVHGEGHRWNPDDIRQVAMAYTALSLAWDEARFADCERLLRGYWGCYLDLMPERKTSTISRPRQPMTFIPPKPGTAPLAPPTYTIHPQ